MKTPATLLLAGILSFIINVAIAGNGAFLQDTSLLKFKAVVDSLNSIYKDSGLTRQYTSLPQANGYYFEFEGDEVLWRELLGAMNRGTNYAEVLKTFKDQATVNEKVYFITKALKREHNKAITEVAAWNRQSNFNYKVTFENEDFFFSDSLKRKWLYNSSINDGKYTLNGFFLTSDFSRQTLPKKYARFIFYTDIITDSSSAIFYENNALSVKEVYDKALQKAHPKLKKYLRQTDYKKKPDSTKYKSPEAYEKAHKKWITKRNKELKKLIKTPKYQEMLNETLNEAFNTGKIYRQLLLDAEQVLPPERILDLKKRIQLNADKKTYLQHMTAMNNNALATNDWSTFIRTYLEMLQYEPVAELNTLKMLGIQTQDFINGLALTASDVPVNHYDMPFSKLENMLTFVKKPEQFEKVLLNMVLDEQLDNHNRLLMYLLYVQFINNAGDVKAINQKIMDLKDEVDYYPQFIRLHIRDLKFVHSE